MQKIYKLQHSYNSTLVKFNSVVVRHFSSSSFYQTDHFQHFSDAEIAWRTISNWLPGRAAC